MDNQLLKIKLYFDSPKDSKIALNYYVRSLEASLSQMIQIDQTVNMKDEANRKAFFNQITKQLPIISTSLGDSAPYIVSVKVLASSYYTHGMGRYVSDVVSRWLIPGKQFPLISVNSLAFEFVHNPGTGLFYHELLVQVDSKKEFLSAKKNLETLKTLIRINILSVVHVRSIVDQKTLTLDQKKLIIQENIASLLGKSRNVEQTIFDQTHQSLVKVLAEEKVLEIQQQIAPLLELRPQIFEREVFNELHETLLQFKEPFIAFRDSKHLTRIIAYMYLFRKTVSNSTLLHPNQRHISLKVLKTKLNTPPNLKSIVGIIVSLNMLRENEVFEERHLVKALQATLPFITKVEDSYFETRRIGSIRNFYIEIKKRDHSPFTNQEISTIKQKLATEVKTRIEIVINPIFIQKNEEEVLRNILVLSNQLKYVHDMPQLMISFLKQTDKTLSFIVILARILRPGDLPLKFLLSKNLSELRIENHEVKSMGLLRKKYPKEANVFEVHIEKQRFLREDFSLDLYEARRVVYDSLTKVLGDIRDYNGGMISKQSEALSALTKLLVQDGHINNFLIENYFYSLKPIYMQSILPLVVLKNQFIMLEQLIEHDYAQHPYFMQMQVVDNYLILMLGSMSISFKDQITKSVEHAHINHNHLTSSLLNTHDITCLGYIYQFSNPKDYENLLLPITAAIKTWQALLEKPKQFDPVAFHLKEKQTL